MRFGFSSAWYGICLSPDSGDGGGGAGGDEGGSGDGGSGAGGEGDDSADEKKAAKALIAEKKALRQRAQAAERERDTAKAEAETFKAEVETHKTKLAELANTVETFKFKDTRSEKLAETVGKLPEGKAIKDPALLQKYAAKLTNPDTLEADINELVSDFTVEASADELVNPLPGGRKSGRSHEIAVDFNNPFQMMKLKESNPAAYDQAVKDQQAAVAATKPTIQYLGPGRASVAK